MDTAQRTRRLTIALAGQPNTGKSTVFNRLTGARQHVGNWPGKTVEQKSGGFRYNGSDYNIVDLPGTYSLTANSLEETIARDFLMKEEPDVVVVMADASQLERSLYLLGEIRLLSVSVVLALNMTDVAERQGKQIDTSHLAAELRVPVVSMTASKGIGFDELMDAIAEAALSTPPPPDTFIDDTLCLEAYERISKLLAQKVLAPYSLQWLAVKLIEGDNEARTLTRRLLSDNEWKQLVTIIETIPDGALRIAGGRYSRIQRVVSASLKGISPNGKKGLRKRGFDRAATHPVWGKFVALGIMVLAFAAAMMVAIPIMGVVQGALPPLLSGLKALFAPAPAWIGSLFVDGLVPGIGIAVMMLAYIFGVYLVFGIMEDVGYLARLAYVFDSWMNKIGLHGKSFMPLMMSFGCNIAGVTGCRVVDSWQQRMTTLVMVSIVPCMALWGVVSFMGTIFFGTNMPLVIFALLAVMLLHLSGSSALLRKFLLKGEHTGLIMELPPYHRPNWRTIWSYVWSQVKGFVKRAVTLIALISLLVWALSYQPDGNMENSLLASIGRFFDPVSSLMGLDWKLFIALVAAVAAKEASLSVLAVLYGISGGVASITTLFVAGTGGYEQAALVGSLASSISPASALAFIFAFFFSIPCIGTVATIYSETKSLRWTLGCSLYYTISSFVAGFLAYHAGLLIF
ncbi:ferrous iron transport protein B [Sediminispirochaeta bajacaliforniensis]|uniref:ferrous iron transport protein B n=1 Tax=Sediminispirochaeta bajacaliforniensis TaxID=148 RepID=UPI000377EB4C|nr:ferrous iron transport protein B [Sediminispirochaeta bajacaliforniensis]